MFFLSGCAALTYEVVWFQLLRLTVGASSISLAMTLTAFMAGLGLGAILSPWVLRRGVSALWVYVGLEVGIAVCGLAMPWMVPWISQVYATVLGYGTGTDLVARAAVCGLVLLPPTVLMGATLPVIAHWLGSHRRAMAGASWLYALNTFGAVTGTLLSGFVWLRYFSTWTASYVAVSLNLAVAVIAIGLAWRTSRRVAVAGEIQADTTVVRDDRIATPPAENLPASDPVLRRRALWVIGVSGFTALGAQVLWTRSVGLLLAVTVYTFAIILAVFLAGLALGSSVGAAAVKRTSRPGVWLAITQLGLVIGIAWAFYAIDRVVPDLRGLGRHARGGSWWMMFSDFVRVAAAIFPATALWGASFPLALALGQETGGRGERWVAKVYAANTIGAILGALGFTFIGFGHLGSDMSAHVLTAAAGVGSILMLRAAASREPIPARGDFAPVRWRLKISVGEFLRGVAQVTRHWSQGLHHAAARHGRIVVAVVALGAGLLAWQGPGVPTDLLVYGHYRSTHGKLGYTMLETREGLAASAGVAHVREDILALYVSGKVVASSIVQDMRIQRMLGHLATVTHDKPRSVLIVGMGTGTTAGSFVLSPDIERIVICEIEPQVIELAGNHFAEENHHVLDDPRTEVVIDDARHYLATTTETFDIITSDPIHPWVKGASALYSREYYELVRARLNPGGVVTQWVPFYETNDRAAKSMLATFFEAFPEGSVWHAGDFGIGQDVVMLGHPDQPRLDLDGWRTEFEEQPVILEDLMEEGIEGVVSLLSRFSSHADDLEEWLTDAQINLDESLRLEYLAGLGLFENQETTILREIEERRRWPNPGVQLLDDVAEEVAELYRRRAARLAPRPVYAPE